MHHANASNNPSEAKAWFELYSKSRASYLNESEDKQILDKVQNTSDPNEANQWLDVYERLAKIKQEGKQDQFSNNMTVAFFFTGIAGVTAAALSSIATTLFPVGGFLIGASAFKIVPNYTSRIIKKLSLKNLIINGNQVSSDQGNTKE